MRSRCGFYSKIGYCEGVVEEFGGEVGELGGKLLCMGPYSKFSGDFAMRRFMVNSRCFWGVVK